jgi:hypothetical protein
MHARYSLQYSHMLQSAKIKAPLLFVFADEYQAAPPSTATFSPGPVPHRDGNRAGAVSGGRGLLWDLLQAGERPCRHCSLPRSLPRAAWLLRATARRHLWWRGGCFGHCCRRGSGRADAVPCPVRCPGHCCRPESNRADAVPCPVRCPGQRGC